MLNQYTKYTRTHRQTIILSIMLMLAFGSLAARAQDSGASPAATKSAPSTSTAPSTPNTATAPSTLSTSQETTTVSHSSSHEVEDGLSTNTMILIGIGLVALLVVGIVIGRSSRTKETISRTTVIK